MIYDASLDSLLQRVWGGDRISLQEARQLYRLPLEELGTLADRRRQLQKASGAPVHVISGASRQGVPELLEALWKVIQEAKRT